MFRSIPLILLGILLLAATETRHLVATRASGEQPANLTHTAAEIARNGERAILSTFEIVGDGSNGAPGTVQPGVGLWDERSQRVIADRQINMPPAGNFTTAVANAGHDAPAIVMLANGGVLIAYGAASTYKSYGPPAAWSCFGTLFCQPFKFATPNKPADIGDDLARSPEYLLPSVGLSELSSATVGDTTIIAGQQQTSSRYGQAGAQGYLSLHASGNTGRFDTTAGPWDFTAGHAPPGDGLQTITRAPNDNAYVDFAITSANGGGTVSFDIGGSACTVSASGSDGASAAASIASAFNSSCGALRDRFAAVAVRYEPLERIGGVLMAPAVVGIESRRGDVTRLPSAAAVRVSCGGGFACASPRGPNTVLDVRGSGLHRHFLFGGVERLGRYVYDIIDVQAVTGSWYGAGHNSLALALACFRSEGPSNGAWTWTDCAGRNAFRLAPGMTPADRLSLPSPYVLGTPVHGYADGMMPYIYDWSMEAQPPGAVRTYPVISAESAALLPDGNLLVAHGCQTRDAHLALCFLRFDAANDRVAHAGFIDAPSAGGSLASIALRSDGRGRLTLAALAGYGAHWGCSGSGPCALTYLYDQHSDRWSRLSSDSLGGANDAGFPGTVSADGRGFLFQLKERSGTQAQIVTFERAAP